MKTTSIAAATAALIAGCGGGSSSQAPASTPAPAPTPAHTAAPVGEYAGVTSDNRAVNTMVLENGTVYAQYGAPGNADIFAGSLIGTVQSSGGTLNVGTGTDYNLEGRGANAVTISGAYVAKQSLDATITYANGTKITSHQTYDTYYDQVPTLQAIAGNYTGFARVPGTNDAATFAIDTAGRVAGSSASGCTFTGTVSPRASGNLYDMSVQFGSTGCAYAGQTGTGMAMIWSPGVVHAFVQTGAGAGIALIARLGP